MLEELESSVFHNYIAHLITNYRNMGYSIILFQKTIKARCPICNSETSILIEEGQLAHYECPNCLSQFLIERIGSIYYIISYKENE